MQGGGHLHRKLARGKTSVLRRFQRVKQGETRPDTQGGDFQNEVNKTVERGNISLVKCKKKQNIRKEAAQSTGGKEEEETVREGGGAHGR